MTIGIETRVSGAEYFEISCHTCRGKLGGLILASEHNGYGENAVPFTLEVLAQAYVNALAHDLQHGQDGDITMYIFRATDGEKFDENLFMSIAATMKPESGLKKFIRGVQKTLTRKERKQEKKAARARRRAGLQ